MIRSQKAKALKGMLASLLVAVMLLVSVVTTPAFASAAAKPAISKTSQTILVGKKYNFDIKNKVKGSTYTWKSSNKKVATVNNKGIVTGVKNGTATITCVVKAPKATYEVSAKVTIRIPATKFAINNKVTALNVGQTYDLNRTLTPKSSNDLTTWTTSDAKIAKPNSKGAFKALKVGEVTITGKTLSGKTDKVTIQVVDKDGTVTTQEGLNALLGSGAARITVKTDDKVALTIPAGDYSNQTLVVDAPNADVVNAGTFKSIEIKNIKADTWTEKAKGNEIVFNAPTGRIVVDKDAVASIRVAAAGANVVIENNGTVESLVVDKKADIEIKGTSKTAIPVTVTAKDTKITADVPLNLTLEAKVTLVLGANATGTVIHVASKDLVPEVQGAGSVKVLIGEGDNVVEETVTATPTPTPGGGTSGGTTPTPTPIMEETVTNKNNDGKFTLSRKLNEIKKVTVVYKVLDMKAEYSIKEELVEKLVEYLAPNSDTLARWKAIDKQYEEKATGYKLIVNPSQKGDATKLVTFPADSGIPVAAGRTYEVTVSGNSVTVVTDTKKEYTLTKDGDYTLKIDGIATDAVSFIVTYK